MRANITFLTKELQAYLDSQSTSVSHSGTTETSFLYFISYSTLDAEITHIFISLQ